MLRNKLSTVIRASSSVLVLARISHEGIKESG